MTKSEFKLTMDLQRFARSKNALTEYYVAELPVSPETEPEWKRLAKYISSVPDETDEETEDTAYYDGDGTPETDVMSVKKGFTFEGLRDPEDEAQNLVANREMTVGDDRKIMLKQVRPNGDVFQGRATATEIIVSGGDASEYQPFECTITWDRLPVKEAVPAG